MRIIDRYITGSIFKIFAGTVLTFSFLYILIDMAANLDELLAKKAGASILFQYYSTFFPVILVQTSAIACLISTLFAYSTLNHHNEIIALRTSGLNFWKVTRPAIFFALIVSAFVFWVGERLVPQAQMTAAQIKNDNMTTSVSPEAVKQKHKPKIRNLTFYGLKNRLFFIDSFDPNTYELEGVTIIGYDNDQNIREKIVAYKGFWTGIIWKFEKCQIADYESDDIKTPTKIKVFEEKLMDIKETPQDFVRQKVNVDSMNIRQLNEYINKFSNSGARKALNNLRVDLHQKIAFPLGNLAVVLVGLPFSLMVGRRKAMTFMSLGIAMMVGFFYYVLNAVGLALGKGGVFPPVISAWLAPVLFACLAIYLIKTKY